MRDGGNTSGFDAAFAEAKAAEARGEVPIGAAILREGASLRRREIARAN